MERPAKRTKLLSDSEDSDNEAKPTTHKKSRLNINKEFAQRLEHNKQREERHRLEEKLQDDDDESSTDESEDDEADLITDALDNEIMSTLQAIKSKDPRVYDKDAKFYREFDTVPVQERSKKGVPMTLKDYHRENLMAGYTGAEEEDIKPQTYDQEQDTLRQNVVQQMHAIADDSDEDNSFTLKKKGLHEGIASVKSKKITHADVVDADKDPETFLSNFMAAQAWRSEEASRHAFNSDDSEDDARADAFEQAYNMRFEDPATANETLKSFARDGGKYSVRREETGGRKRARDREREQKEQAKRERHEEHARLRKLKIDEAEQKLKAIKQAAGLDGKSVSVEEWRELLDGDFSDAAWDKEMERRFGETYYAEKEVLASKDLSKPVWDDDIDIKDLVPEFVEKEEPTFALSDDEPTEEVVARPKSKKDREREKQDAKAQHRRERREIEGIIDAALPVTVASSGGFRYRETSPNSFGMNARDILFASDSQLNQFAGLKKLAAFRDEERKAKDKKKLGKKARLREWRKEVFGNPDGASEQPLSTEEAELPSDGTKKTSRRKRSKKNKTSSVAV